MAADFFTTEVWTARGLVTYFHGERNHQGIGNELIQRLAQADGHGQIRRHQRIGGMLNYYFVRRKRPGDPDRIIGHYAISDKKRLRDLEAENAKLKRMSADLALENAATYQLAI